METNEFRFRIISAYTNLIDRISYISKFSITKPTSSFEEVSINLSDYDIKIINEDGLILLPISIASLLISSPCNINFYFNPLYNDKTVFGFEGYPLPLVYSAINENFKGSISTLEERKNNLSYIELFIDQFYGLKEYKNMSSLDNVISSFETYKNDILSTSSDTYQFAEINYFNNLNDLHTSLITYSPLSNYYDHDIIHSDSYNNLAHFSHSSKSIEDEFVGLFPSNKANNIFLKFPDVSPAMSFSRVLPGYISAYLFLISSITFGALVANISIKASSLVPMPLTAFLNCKQS